MALYRADIVYPRKPDELVTLPIDIEADEYRYFVAWGTTTLPADHLLLGELDPTAGTLRVIHRQRYSHNGSMVRLNPWVMSFAVPVSGTSYNLKVYDKATSGQILDEVTNLTPGAERASQQQRGVRMLGERAPRITYPTGGTTVPRT